MSVFSETQGGGAMALLLASVLNDTAEGTYVRTFQAQMQGTDNNAKGSKVTLTISWSASGTEPGTLTASCSHTAHSGGASVGNVDAYRVYYSTAAAPTTYNDYFVVELGQIYDMSSSSYTLQLTGFSITIDNT